MRRAASRSAARTARRQRAPRPRELGVVDAQRRRRQRARRRSGACTRARRGRRAGARRRRCSRAAASARPRRPRARRAAARTRAQSPASAVRRIGTEYGCIGAAPPRPGAPRDQRARQAGQVGLDRHAARSRPSRASAAPPPSWPAPISITSRPPGRKRAAPPAIRRRITQAVRRPPAARPRLEGELGRGGSRGARYGGLLTMRSNARPARARRRDRSRANVMRSATPCVAALRRGNGQRGGRDVDRGDPRIRQLASQRHGDAAGAGAKVADATRVLVVAPPVAARAG